MCSVQSQINMQQHLEVCFIDVAVGIFQGADLHAQNLEFVAETKILADMKSENHGKKNDKHTFF